MLCFVFSFVRHEMKADWRSLDFWWRIFNERDAEWLRNDFVYDGIIINLIYCQFLINFYMPKRSPTLPSRWMDNISRLTRYVWLFNHTFLRQRDFFLFLKKKTLSTSLCTSYQVFCASQKYVWLWYLRTKHFRSKKTFSNEIIWCHQRSHINLISVKHPKSAFFTRVKDFCPKPDKTEKRHILSAITKCLNADMTLSLQQGTKAINLGLTLGLSFRFFCSCVNF